MHIFFRSSLHFSIALFFVTHIMILRYANCLQVQWHFNYAANIPAKESGRCLLCCIPEAWVTNLVQGELSHCHIFLPEPLKGTVRHSNHCWKSGTVDIQHLKHSEKPHFKTSVIFLHHQAIMSLLITCNLKDPPPGVSCHVAS